MKKLLREVSRVHSSEWKSKESYQVMLKIVIWSDLHRNMQLSYNRLRFKYNELKLNIMEMNHYGMTVHLLKRHSVDPEWRMVFKELEAEIIDMYQLAITLDHNWIDYQFEDNPQLLGINSKILKEYVNYNAKIVMQAVNLPPVTSTDFDPCSWAKKYNKPSLTQTAQKEKDNANYLLGSLNVEISDNDWKEFKL